MEVTNMDKAKKSATNNQWCSSCSTEGTKYFHDKAKKSAGNNQWVSTGLGRADQE